MLLELFGLEKRTTLVVTGSGVGQDSTLNRIFGSAGATSAGINVTVEGAQAYAAFYRAVTLIAETIASLPLHVYRVNGTNGDKEEARDHPVFQILHRRPNPAMTSFFCRQAAMAYVLLYGRHYSFIETDGRGDIVGLWPMRTPDVERIRRDGSLVYDVRRVRDNDLFPRPPFRGDREILQADQVMELTTFDGESIIGHAREQLGEALAAQSFGGGFYAGGAQPYAVVTSPGKIDGEAFRKNWEAVHGGSKRRLAVLQNGQDIKTLSMPLNDAQFLESRKFYVTEIARWFGIPPHKLMDLERATFCLPAESEVYTAQGPKKIVDIERGDSVWSLGKDGTFQLSTVNRSECTGQDDILLLRTTNRTLRLNARHRVLAHRKHQSPRGGKGGYQCVGWITEYVPAGELRVGDMIVNARKLPDSKRCDTPTRKATVGFMEFCGLLLGDGNIHKGTGSAYVTIARAKTATYMNHYRKVMQAEFHASTSGGRGNLVTRKDIAIKLQEGERYTRFSSISAVRELAELGLSGTARTKRVPDWVFGMSDEYKLALLRGFLDADGSVDKLGRISFSSCNETMLSQIRHLCIALSIPVTNLRCQEGVTTLPNGERKAYRQFCFTCSDPGQNRAIGSHDPRYVARLNAGKPFDRKGRAYPDFGGSEFDLADCELSRISAIENHPAEPVYDLEVDGTHSFIANGVVVHNSNIEEQNLEWYESLIPRLVMIEQEANRQLLADDESLFCKHGVDGLLRGNRSARFAAHAIGIQNGLLSPNEVRRLEDQNSIGPQGDIYMVPANLTTPGKLADIGDETPTTPTDTAETPDPAADPLVETEQEIQTLPATTLNGGQITAAMAIVDAVTTEKLPRDAALGSLQVLLNLSPEMAEKVMGSVGNGFKAEKPAPTVPLGQNQSTKPEETDPKEDKVNATMTGAAKAGLIQAAERMLAKEAAEIRHAAGKPNRFNEWLDEYRAKWPARWEHGMAAAIAASKGIGVAVEASLSTWEQRCFVASEALNELSGAVKADELAGRVVAEVEGWPTADEIVNKLIKEMG